MRPVEQDNGSGQSVVMEARPVPESWRVLLDAVPTAVVIVAPDGAICFTNRTSPVSSRKQTSCLFSLQSIPMYTFIVVSFPSLEILANASSCDPVMALATRYVFNRVVWLDLGNHPTEALAALGARSPFSQIRGRWSRSCGMIGVTSTLFYSISFSPSSIANWVHALLGAQ